MDQTIRIKLKSYDYNLVDKSAEKIVKTVKATGAVISGPIPLPTHRRIFTVNRSTFVNKKSREQFQLSSYKRLIDIHNSTGKTVDALMKLELPSGVEVEIKVIEVGPCVVTQVKTADKDGYEAVQLGFVEKKDKHTTAPMAGHFKKAGVAPQRHLAEFKGFGEDVKLGDTLTVDLFNEDDFVDIQGTSKGKGFQGVVKRHGFGGAYGRPDVQPEGHHPEPPRSEGSPRAQRTHHQGFYPRKQRFNRFN